MDKMSQIKITDTIIYINFISKIINRFHNYISELYILHNYISVLMMIIKHAKQY